MSPRGPREAHAFEPLEERFLLSGLVDGPVLDRSHLLPLPASVISQLPAGPRTTSTTDTDPVETFLFRDDTYTLKSIDGQPSVRVDLIWPEGPDPSAGRLLVSDDSGLVLYVVPLSGLEGINAILPIPTSQGGSSNLDVSLQINLPTSGSSSAGSYRISIYWVQTNSTSASLVATPQPSAASTPQASGLTPLGASTSTQANGALQTPPIPSVFGTPTGPAPTNTDAGPPSPRPTLTATKDLPTPIPLPTNPGPAGLTGGSGSGNSVVALSDPALSRAVVIPTAPMAGLSSAATSSAASTSPATFEVPLPSTSGSLSGSAEGGRPAVVGPLPLSGSSPDGGIFAYGQAKGPGDPFRAIFTTAATPDTLDGPDSLASSPSRLRSRGYAVPVPWEGPGLGASIARSLDLELAGTPSATGSAFLPMLLPVAEARVGRDSHRSAASRWPILYARIKPRTSIAALVFGSAGLFFGLVAPDCVVRLGTWKEDRRWKRPPVLSNAKTR